MKCTRPRIDDAVNLTDDHFPIPRIPGHTTKPPIKRTYASISGSDGWIRVWDLHKIYNAEPGAVLNGERPVFRIDPMNEVEVEAEADLVTIVRSSSGVGGGAADDDQANYWFLQDATGFVWKVDLSFSLSMQKPSRVYRCHASAVTTLGSSVMNPFLVSGGADGKACVYDLNRKTVLNYVWYSAGVTCLQWMPIEVP